MKYVEITHLKEEIDELWAFIKLYSEEIDGEVLEQRDQEFYRFIAKQIVFFKKILITYPKSYFVRVLISDLYSLIINDIKKEKRYYYLNQRSIIENYIRMIVKNEENNSHITRKSFLDLKEHNPIKESEYGKLMNEYKIACSYIHGGEKMSEYLVTNFEESIKLSTTISQRQRKNQIYQFTDLINILNGLFLSNNYEDVDSAFHRSKVVLKYLMGNNYLEKLNEYKSNNKL